MTLLDEPDAGATLSPDGLYRYHLWRDLPPATFGTCVFIMLNPSTADASLDDPTIRKCKGFASRWGYRRLEVVNLFAWRATDPSELPLTYDPVGSENDRYIAEACKSAAAIVCAWGGNKFAQRRAEEVKQILRELHLPRTYALKVGVDGSPYHPLYVPYGTLPDYFL